MSNQCHIVQWASKFVRCGDCGLKKFCFPKKLTEEETTALGAIVASNTRYDRGDYLYHPGECLNDLIIIKAGSAKTELISESGTIQIVGFHYPGDLLGLDAIGSKQTPSAVIFLEDSSVCAIPYEPFNTLSESAPHLHEEIISRFSNEIAHSNEFRLSMHNHSAEQRFAVFLLELSSRSLNRGFSKESLHLSMSRNDIANYLGLAAATLSRIIGKFERNDFIQVDNRNIHLSNQQALVDLVKTCEECSAVYI